MTKMTKMGIICNMVAEMCHNLSQAQRDSKTYEESKNHEYYHRAKGLGFCLISMGIDYKIMTTFRSGRTYFIGVSISDMTKGSPAFSDMAYSVFPLGVREDYSVLFSDFVEQCEVNEYDYVAMKKEIRKIYGCK